jgi:hypothetical protein
MRKSCHGLSFLILDTDFILFANKMNLDLQIFVGGFFVAG